MLEKIATRLKNGEINDAEADAARLAFLSRLPSPRWTFVNSVLGNPHPLLAASAVLLLASGVGAAVYHDGKTSDMTGLAATIPFSEPDGELLTQLTDYARTLESGQTSTPATPGEYLPDVNAMIERLAARLESTPQDLEGWRMLGWSYFHTERYEQAAAAFGKALELDPASAELKLSYEEAKAKASGNSGLRTSSSLQTGTIAGNPSIGKVTTPEALPERERDVAIRAMVNGLAQRLESSPRDIEGWIHLMRSRVVLGDHPMAVSAFRKARAAFVDDSAASGRIEAAGAELGLKFE
jgi:cytochrome c-type biogenesis protein CcmH